MRTALALIASLTLASLAGCTPTRHAAHPDIRPRPESRWEQLHTVLTVHSPGPGDGLIRFRSIDSGRIAMLVTTDDPDIEDDRATRREWLVVLTGRDEPIVIERRRSERFAEWGSGPPLSWEPGGDTLLVSASRSDAERRDDMTAWFRVDPLGGIGTFTFDEPLIGTDSPTGDANLMYVPVFDIHAEMHAVPYDLWTMPERTRPTNDYSRTDTPALGGVLLDDPVHRVEHAALVNSRSGVVVFTTGDHVDLAAPLEASLVGWVLLFDWKGRTLAGRWTLERYADTFIPSVPGGFQTVDLGPDSAEVTPVAAIFHNRVVLWIRHGSEGRLVIVQP